MLKKSLQTHYQTTIAKRLPALLLMSVLYVLTNTTLCAQPALQRIDERSDYTELIPLNDEEARLLAKKINAAQLRTRITIYRKYASEYVKINFEGFATALDFNGHEVGVDLPVPRADTQLLVSTLDWLYEATNRQNPSQTPANHIEVRIIANGKASWHPVKLVAADERNNIAVLSVKKSPHITPTKLALKTPALAYSITPSPTTDSSSTPTQPYVNQDKIVLDISSPIFYALTSLHARNGRGLFTKTGELACLIVGKAPKHNTGPYTTACVHTYLLQQFLYLQ